MKPLAQVRLRAARAIAATLFLAFSAIPGGAEPPSRPVEIRADAITAFGPLEVVQGGLKFVGGVVLRSDEEDFGGLSGLRISPDGSRLFSVSDRGNWLTARIVRDAGGKIAGLEEARLSCICRKDGTPYPSLYWGDAEGLEIDGNKAWISFERLDRINVYDLRQDFTPGPPESAAASFKAFDLVNNKGLEALALVPPGTPLAGRLLAFAEESVNAQGDHRAYIAGPDRNLEFSIIRSDDYAITDAVFASDGSLLVLERRYGFSVGVGMRIRRFDAGSIAPGTRLEGTTLIEAGLTNRIDNMEGIGFYRDATGRDRIVLVSDDNFSRFQETLVLEFEIVP